MTNPEDNLIAVVTDKEITKLYKALLEILEDLQGENAVMLAKVADKVSPEFAESINFFTKERYEQLRKRILDCGNESNRSLLHFLSFFDSTVNTQRLQEAAQKRTLYKKTIVSEPVIL